MVKKLVEPWLDKGRTLVLDNFFTKIPLGTYLYQRKTFTLGTIRSNSAGMPKKFAKDKSQKVLHIYVVGTFGFQKLSSTDESSKELYIHKRIYTYISTSIYMYIILGRNCSVSI